MSALTQARLVRTLDAVRSAVLEAVAMISRAGLFVAVAVVGGIGSGWYLTSRPSAVTALRAGPWVSWTQAGRPDADPYTRAHFARLGALATNAAVAQTFEARTDETGQNLHSSCEYAIEGTGLDTVWWSLTAYNESGQLIANPADRHVYNSSTIARGPDGSYLVSLAREARPGNWLPTGGAGRVVLQLAVHQAPVQLKLREQAGIESQLPRIRRVDCR